MEYEYTEKIIGVGRLSILNQKDVNYRNMIQKEFNVMDLLDPKISERDYKKGERIGRKNAKVQRIAKEKIQ